VQKPDKKWVIEFPVESPESATVKADMTAESFLDCVRSTQLNWVVPGTARGNAHHNVSNTVSVRSSEWGIVQEYIWKHRADFTGVSLLPDDDTLYAFSPFEEVKTAAQQRRYNELVSSYQAVDYRSMFEAEDGTSLSQEPAC